MIIIIIITLSFRLWVVPRTSVDSEGPQQIGYVNIVPARSRQGGFESFGDAVRRFNDQLRQRPLPGKLFLQVSHSTQPVVTDVGASPSVYQTITL